MSNWTSRSVPESVHGGSPFSSSWRSRRDSMPDAREAPLHLARLELRDEVHVVGPAHVAVGAHREPAHHDPRVPEHPRDACGHLLHGVPAPLDPARLHVRIFRVPRRRLCARALISRLRRRRASMPRTRPPPLGVPLVGEEARDRLPERRRGRDTLDRQLVVDRRIRGAPLACPDTPMAHEPRTLQLAQRLGHHLRGGSRLGPSALGDAGDQVEPVPGPGEERLKERDLEAQGSFHGNAGFCHVSPLAASDKMGPQCPKPSPGRC